MTTWFVCRHPGALEWARTEGLEIDETIAHLDLVRIEPGDVVIGVLPVHLAATVQQRGARYVHICLDLPPACRGLELCAQQMRRFGARLQAYCIEPEDAAC